MSRRPERQPNPSPLGGYLASKVREREMTLSDVAEITEHQFRMLQKFSMDE